MKSRRVSREEAERVYGSELAGRSLHFGELQGATIEAIRLPARPTPGGSRGNGFLPLTYECSVDGQCHTLITQDGPEVDDLRAFLHATVDDLAADQRVELWFENTTT